MVNNMTFENMKVHNIAGRAFAMEWTSHDGSKIYIPSAPYDTVRLY